MAAEQVPGYRIVHMIGQGGQAQDSEAGNLLRRSEEHTSELQSPCNLVCRLLLEKKKKHRSRRAGWQNASPLPAAPTGARLPVVLYGRRPQRTVPHAALRPWRPAGRTTPDLLAQR